MAVAKNKKHKPFHCDICDSWLRDQDVAGRRGRADRHRTWAVLRDMKSGEIQVQREEVVVCLRCAALGRPDQLIRRNAASLVAWFNEQEELEKKKGGKNQ